MAYGKEIYRYRTSSTCERCKNFHDGQTRIVQFETSGGSTMYICTECIKNILFLLESKVNISSASFAMYREDFIRYVVSEGKKESFSAEVIRAEVAQWEEDQRTLCKEFLDYKNGYTDRTKFFFDLRKHIKGLLAIVEQALKR